MFRDQKVHYDVVLSRKWITMPRVAVWKSGSIERTVWSHIVTWSLLTLQRNIGSRLGPFVKKEWDWFMYDWPLSLPDSLMVTRIHSYLLRLWKDFMSDHSNESSSAVLSHGLFIYYVVWIFYSVDEILWCCHLNETSSAVLKRSAVYLYVSSNFWVCGWNPTNEKEKNTGNEVVKSCDVTILGNHSGAPRLGMYYQSTRELMTRTLYFHFDKYWF